MHRDSKKRKIIIFSLIGILFLMAVGYSAFNTKLSITGNSQITSNWDVEIINVQEGEKTGLAESAKIPTWTKTEASMEVNLYQKGDSMSYIVTFENKGSFDAKLDNINLGKGTNEEAVNITFSGYTKGQTLFKGTTTDITVTISYNPNYEGGETSSEVNTDFEFSQANNDPDAPKTYLVTYDCVTNSGNVVAKVTDGTNTVSSSYNVTIVKPVDITDNVVTSGDGLYKDEYENGRYVYKGTDPDNYIMFNNELWRIISKEADGTYKILRNETLPEKMAFDSKGARTTGYCSQGQAEINGCNAWGSTANMVGSPSEFTNGNYSGSVDADSEMLTYLNGEYLDSITVNKDKIVNHDFSIGGVTYGNNDLQSQITSENSYKWNGNIGLISVSDYLRANSDMETCGTHSTNNSANTTCRHTNWMHISGTYWWTLSPSAGRAYGGFYVFTGGSLLASDARYSSGVRPAVFLSSSLSFSGSGSQSNPYRIIG